jgi:hypothetical protein
MSLSCHLAGLTPFHGGAGGLIDVSSPFMKQACLLDSFAGKRKIQLPFEPLLYEDNTTTPEGCLSRVFY